MGSLTGIIVSVVAGLVLAGVGAFTLTSVASSSPSAPIEAPLVQYGTN